MRSVDRSVNVRCERLTDDFQRTVYLRTVQDWIVRPEIKAVPGGSMKPINPTKVRPETYR